MTQHAPLNQEIAGQGFPLVVLHGLFGDLDNFRSIAKPLESDFQVIRLDLPSHGESPRLPNLSIDAIAASVHDHLKQTGVAKYHLLGHSLGGKVAMQMAGNQSMEDIEKLLIIDIAPRVYPPHHDDIIDALQQVDLYDLENRSMAEKQLRKLIPNAGVRGFLLKSLYKRDADSYDWRFDLDSIKASYEAIRQTPTFKNRVSAPTLFLRGGDSDYLLDEDQPTINNHFLNPQFEEISGTGHWLHAEKPDLFTSICLDFLNNG